MTTILQINSAARKDAQSTLLANELVAKLQQSHPDATLVVRDLLTDSLPHLDEAVLGAFFTPAEQRNAQQQAIIARSDALVAQLKAADIIVIGAPMYNFGISSQLKAYFDHVARAGVTFRYTAQGPQGLITGKKVYVVTARGGKYLGTPADLQTPYLKMFLAFIGLTDVTFIFAEGLNLGEQSKQSGLAAAREAIAAV